MQRIAPYYKAVTGLLVPFLTSIAAAVQDSSGGGSAITSHEWISSVIVGLVAGGAVFAIPNKDPEGTHQEESTQPPEEGYVGEHVAQPHPPLEG